MSKMNLAREVEKDTFIGWAVCEMLGDKYEQVYPNQESVLGAEVRITINGVEVDFESALNQLHSQYKAQIEERAKELLREKTGDLVETIYDLQRKAIEAVGS